MSETSQPSLVDCLRDRVGDDLLMVSRFTDEDTEFLYGEEWFERFVAEAGTRSREKMHQDAVYDLRQADIGGELCGTRIKSKVTVTEGAVGVALYPGDGVGYYVTVDDDGSVELPDLVDECLAAVGVDP